MTGERLAVLLDGRVVAHLERDDASPDPSLTYLPQYAASGAIPLSVRLPLQSRPHPPGRVRPYLLGLLPENLATRENWARRLDTGADDPFGLLAAMGWDCPGAVQFCPPQAVEDLQDRDQSYVALAAADVATRLHDLRNDSASWAMEDEHWSLGGQQEKFALARFDGQWFRALGSAATTHIIKPGIRQLQHQALIEYATMRAASLVGVDTAEVQFQAFEGEWALIIQRFDREVLGARQVRRLHQEDFVQAVGREPARKYESNNGPGLRDLMSVIGRASRNPSDEALAVADFLIINVIAGAPDGHAKNIALLHLADGGRVAPLYDVATGLTYDRDDVERRIAVSVGGERHLGQIRGQHWDKAAKVLGLPPEVMRARVEQIASHFPGAFDEALGTAAGAPGVDAVAERTRGRLSEHCDRIVSRL